MEQFCMYFITVHRVVLLCFFQCTTVNLFSRNNHSNLPRIDCWNCNAGNATLCEKHGRQTSCGRDEGIISKIEKL